MTAEFVDRPAAIGLQKRPQEAAGLFRGLKGQRRERAPGSPSGVG